MVYGTQEAHRPSAGNAGHLRNGAVMTDTDAQATDVVISAAGLLAELAAGTDTVLLEVRREDSAEARAAYQAGHLPGAHFVTLTAQLAGPRSPLSGNNPLPADDSIGFGMNVA